jgi:hypothetical protein
VQALLFLGVLAGLLLVVFTVILNDNQGVSDDGNIKMMHFQQMIGGVGLGAVIVPAWNFCDYDPRLQPDPIDILYPIPGGYAYSPDRLAMVTSFRKAKISFP